MDKLKNAILRKLIVALSFFYSDKIWRGIRYFKRLIISEAYRRKLGAGEGFYIHPPIVLIGGKNIRIGKNFHARDGFILQAWKSYENKVFEPQIIIGDNVSIGFDCHIGAISKVSIGNDVLMGSKIYISDHYHGEIATKDLDIPPIKRELYSKGHVTIGDGVWIGDNVSIMPGVRIGNKSIIGANSVVTKDVPERTVVAGVPARIIKQL